MQFKAEYYAVLEALATGDKTVSEIAELVDMEPHEVESILSSLTGLGLVERREKGFLFKKEVYTMTGRGWEVLHVWRQQVRETMERVVELRQQGRAREAEALLEPLGPVLPLLLTLGLLDMSLYAAAVGGLPSQEPAPEEVEEFDVEDVEF